MPTYYKENETLRKDLTLFLGFILFCIVLSYFVLCCVVLSCFVWVVNETIVYHSLLSMVDASQRPQVES
jgi:hypothetical protein